MNPLDYTPDASPSQPPPGSDTAQGPDATNEAVNNYVRARAWVETAEFVASDAMYAVCVEVEAGRLSAREAARRTGVSKSAMSRAVDQVRNGTWTVSALSPHLDEQAYRTVTKATTGSEEDPPFEWVDADDGRRVRWVDDH